MSPAVQTLLRVAFVAIGVAALGLAAGLALQWPPLLGLWPWADGYSGLSPLSAIFLGSIAAAIGAPVLWIGIQGDWRAITGGALNLAITYLGSGLYVALEAARSSARKPLLAPVAAGLVASAVLMVALAVWARRHPPRDPRATPLPVRLAFGFFVVVLLLAGGAMVLGVPHVMPWPITPQMSVIYGFVFLGAAAYFVYGLRHPVWTFAQGPLIGFLAYDLVLIGPFVRHFERVAEPMRPSLVVYTAVVVASGVLAAAYLWAMRAAAGRDREA